MHPPQINFHWIHCRRFRGQRGSVILFVLGIILLTAFLLTRFIDRAHTELLTTARQNQNAPLRDEAYSALQVSLAVLADFSAVDNGLHSPEQGWGDPLTYADYTPPKGIKTEVRIEDESGKLSLPSADTDALNSLLTTIGFLESDAERLTDGILAWSRPDHPTQFSGSDDSAYQRLDPPITPPHEPLRSFNELRLIPAARALLMDETGRLNDYGERFIANVSLFDFHQTNLNTANEDMLSALGIQSSGDTPAPHDSSRPPRVFNTLDEAAADLGALPQTNQIGVDAAVLRIVITASEGGRQFQLSAVVQTARRANSSANTPGGAAPTSDPRPWTLKSIDSPFQILEIQEHTL